MKREKRLTKKERKALAPPRAAGANNAQNQHIHCIACGRHIDPPEFEPSVGSAKILRCEHGSSFPSCTGCTVLSQSLLDEHDRSGQAVKTAAAWH
ncbi:MAG: hypothetical protein Q8Q09_28555 [Deltaproteobacteria bacterium]|nr:hypothetical protein [Deltaproteobacteria bacterium]